MSRIPANIPFNLGSAQELPAVAARNLTSLVPTQRLPFTLSAKTVEQEISYGSVGWSIVCRSHEDFQTEIFRTSDMAPPTFSKELSGSGMASVSFDLDHYLFNKTLKNGRPVEDLFDYENLWEIYFDKKLRFQFLGTAVRETPLDASEVRTASVSGNGIAQVLSWASVYPQGFPEIVRKIETLKDDFGGDAIDNTIWTMTSATTGGIEVTPGNAKADLAVAIEQTTQDKIQKTEEFTQASNDLAAAVLEYNQVYKDAASTTAEKKAVAKEVTDARTKANKLGDEVVALTSKLADLNQKNALAGAAIEGDTARRAKLIVKNSGDSKTLAAGMFEIKSSGVSAKIEALPQGSTGGQARTTFGIINSESFHAYFFTALIGGARRLVAEVSDSSGVYTDDFSYDPTAMAYWRIREDHAAIIFETSPTGQTWVERYRVEDVSWADKSVSFLFKAELSGNAGVIPPLYAYISSINASTIPSVDTVMAVYREYLQEAQDRGTIPYVVTEFTDDQDTAGASWVGKPNVDVQEGTNLLQLLQNFSQLQQFDWIMDNDFKLKVYQRVWNSNESDPTVSFHKEDKIVLHEGNAQLIRERSRDRNGIGNSIVGKNASGEYAYMEDNDSISKFQRREMFISAGNAPDLASLGTVLESSLAQVAEEKSSWRIQVDPNIPGKRVFEDYDVGDWIGIEMIDSQGNITRNAWRVVGIAIQVAAESGLTTAELTLQSRMQLLAERLQQQVANMGSSATNAGVTLGSAVSAATLIEQAKLANMLDVTLPPSDLRKQGDVLTWTGDYFSLTTPGDKTIPAAPTILDIASNVYYPENGRETRAQVEFSWTTPLNEDGSTITDGHHYEVRFRPEMTLPYSATWEEAAELDEWQGTQTWSQPTTPPIFNTGWQTIFISFDETSAVIQELSPSVRYEFQVRAVDSSTPQHFGEWSDTALFEAADDTIPPAQPAAPEIISGRLSVQVIHYLGKDEGGTFNLPPDMSHLEVHVGGPSFHPSEDSYVGKIVADVSIIRGRTPVIQTFNIDSVEDIYVRVVAVDKSGNRSTPSKAASPIRTDLIDDAHISDLTASKITAGTISSAIVLSGIIKTAEFGARAEMNFEGFRIYSEEEDETVSLLGNPGTTGNFLLIKDLENSGQTLASIDGTGRGSFQNVSVVNDIQIKGENLLTDVINPRGKGIVAIGMYEGTPVVGAGINVERGFLEISFIAEESRTYVVHGITEFDSTAPSVERMILRLRDGGVNEPTIGSTWLQQSIASASYTASGANAAATITYAGTFTPGLHRILLSFSGTIGNCTVNALVGANSTAKSFLWVEDVGIPMTDTVILNDGGVDEINTPSSTDKAARPAPKVEYTKTYTATWSGTYRSNGDHSPSHDATMIQGNSGADTWLNDSRGLCGFNYTQIKRDLAGATIKGCYITLYANHWYWNDGGTARIGTHTYASRPSNVSSGRYNAQRINSEEWPKPGKRKVSLGTSIGNEFKAGTCKGIILGPTNGTKTQYGRFNGAGQLNPPTLTFVYVK